MKGNNESINLQEIIARIIEKTGSGKSGGHLHAAGAVIEVEKEKQFIKAAEEVLSTVLIEDIVN